MTDYAPFDFRPPPPSRLFPDIAVHLILAQGISDPLVQKIAAGLLLFAATIIPIGVFQGFAAFAGVTIILISGGLDVLNSATHFSLPLTILFVRLLQARPVGEALMLAVVVGLDLMAAVPAALLFAETQPRQRHVLRGAAILAGLAVSAFYADFGAAYAELLAFMPVWITALVIARKLAVRTIFCVAVGIALVGASALGVVPPRYALPVAASMLVLLAPVQVPRFDWRYAALPAVVAALFLATADTQAARTRLAAYDCLVSDLTRRGISEIALDHWTAKPFALAAKAQGKAFSIAQTDFAEGDTHLWMAPYAFTGTPTPWAVRNIPSCTTLEQEARYCAQATTAHVISREPVCGDFELFHYSEPVPPNYAGPIPDKMTAIRRHFIDQLEKARINLGL